MPASTTRFSRNLLLALTACLNINGNVLAQEYDSVIAEIPATQAATGSVALANLNIALRAARLQALETLCQGHWIPIGQTMHVTGPRLSVDASGQPVWHYQSLRQAHPLACAGVSRTHFFLETSRYLPAWVTIRPAGYSAAFRSGKIESSSSTSLANR